MKFKPILIWVAGYEIFTWLWIWIAIRTPWEDPHDGTVKPTTSELIRRIHGQSFIVLLVVIVAIVALMRVWNGSNRRHGRRRW